jgi:hypothetical protein
MSFEDHSLPYFKLWLITLLLSAHLLFQALFTESSCGVQLLTPSPFSSALRAPCPLCCVSFSGPCLLFRVFLVFFGRAGVSLSWGLCWFIPGVDVGILCATYLLTCWSVSPKEVWSQCLVAQEPSCFLSVTWCGEALYRLGAWGVRVLLLLGVFILPSVAPVSQQAF